MIAHEAEVLASARQRRLHGLLDEAEAALNVVCSLYRAAGEKNHSRAYRRESRAVWWARMATRPDTIQLISWSAGPASIEEEVLT